MTSVPVTIIDNFFPNPDAVREWALSLEYAPHPEYIYHGQRTECLSEIDWEFYKYVNSKILSLFCSNPIGPVESVLKFHLCKSLDEEGWIHQDDNIITCIIYLSPSDPNVNRGTSLYKLKSNLHYPDLSNLATKSQTQNYYKTGKLPEEQKIQKLKFEQDNFEKILDVKDKYNRLVCFSPEVFHKNNKIDSLISSDRLTLINFIYGVGIPNTLPGPRHNHSQMF